MTDYRDTIGSGSDRRRMSQTGVNVGPDEGFLYIDGIDEPAASVKPGTGLATFTVNVVNGAGQIYFDEDKCIGDGGRAGYKAIVHARPSWTNENTKTECFEMSTVGAYEHSVEFKFTVPDIEEANNYRVQFWLEGASSGSKGNTHDGWVTVEPEGSIDPGPENGNNDDDTDGGTNWTKWILDNPGKAAILGVGGMAVLNFGLDGQ